MEIKYILKKLEKYTSIPRLAFEFESEEYIYMANVMDQINYIIKNLNIIEMSKENLKIYKDDKETINNIKEGIKYYEQTINKSLEVLEENYMQHKEKLNSQTLYDNEDEQEQ